jgi:hypothetical protein
MVDVEIVIFEVAKIEVVAWCFQIDESLVWLSAELIDSNPEIVHEYPPSSSMSVHV